MARWKPDARTRLEQAALELYSERGFQQTTVAEIAQRAGLTERTFFRYFADKREVLFSGASALEARLVSALDDAPDTLSAIDAVGVAVEVGASLFEDRRDFARQRQAAISANAELAERERIKLASLASALADGLRRRGVGDSAASLAAEMGIAVFRIAFERWIEGSNQRALPEIVRASLNQLKVVAGGE
ncbi:MAG: TetR family transcriptional regulator [Candidatus Tumulicola sp.]